MEFDTKSLLRANETPVDIHNIAEQSTPQRDDWVKRDIRYPQTTVQAYYSYIDHTKQHECSISFCQ